MQYVKGLQHYENARETAVTFGKFDGLHIGHQKLVNTVRHLGIEEDVDSVVCAFDMEASRILMSKEERELHLEEEVDYLVDCLFTEEFRQMSAEDFIKGVIRDIFHAKYVVVGTDFQFGYGKKGDIHVLDEYQESCGYRLVVIEKERYHDRIISSSYIKEILKKGDIPLANRLLGYPYGISGMVEHGKQLGRTLGFPTLNVEWPAGKVIPPFGVYLCRVYMDGRGYNGIANLGVKPTVSDENRIWFESFLLGYEGDAYGKEVMIDILEFTRPEQKFSGKDELKANVDKDIACGKRYFGIG